MPEVEVSREDVGQVTVFEAFPSTTPPMRYLPLMYAALLEAGLIGVSELMMEPAGTMLRWLAFLCAVPLILLWLVSLLRAARRGAVRLTVEPEGLRAYGHIYPHKTIRDIALYPPGQRRPLFVSRIDRANSRQHQAELDLVTGNVAVEGAGGKRSRSQRNLHGFRLVLHRHGQRPPVILVHGLTLSGGETLFAGLAAELRKHSPTPPPPAALLKQDEATAAPSAPEAGPPQG
ncbi:hypothetical protein [Azospirillum sp. sgz302134]